MRTSILTILLSVLAGVFSACDSPINKTRPSDYFSAGQQEALLREIVLKTTRKPEGNLNSEEIAAWYSEQLKSYQWHFAHEENGRFYYFISRPAPSLYGKRAGLGGSFSSPDRLKINGFKEEFHTFKMKPDELLSKGAILFEKMVNHQDLTQYQPGRKGKEEWIEFPDPLNYYDSTSQSWMMKTAP